MTRKITMKALKPLDGAEQDLAALADQWVDRNFYLPPGGDHSWREREARRLFGNDGKEPINDEENVPSAEWDAPAASEANGPYEPGFRRAGARNILLPVSLAACALLFAGGFWVSQILPSGFWGPQEPKMLPATPHMINVVAEEGKGMPGLTDAGNPDFDGNGAASRPRLQSPGPAIAPAKAEGKGTLPRLRPPIVAKPDAPDAKPVVRAAKAQAPGVRSSRTPPAKSLPPIGAAYFASHAPAAASRQRVAGSLPPIGQAYFESRARAVSD